MSTRRARRWLIILGIVVTVVIVGIVASANLIAKLLIVRIAGSATGTSVSLASSHVTFHDATLTGLRVRSLSGEPIATIPKLHVAYDLRDLLAGSGSKRAYGLESLEIDSPTITIIRHKDGTLNLPTLKTAATGAAGPPMIFTGYVKNGRVVAINRAVNQAPLEIDRVHASFDINTAATSRYVAGLTYREAGRSYPIAGRGTIDVPDRYGLQQWNLPALPVAHIIAFAMTNDALRVRTGTLGPAQIRIALLPSGSSATFNAISGTAPVRALSATIKGLNAPVQDVHGLLDLTSNGVTFRDATGSLGGIPIAASGGVVDLAHPQLRVALAANTDGAHVRRIITQAQRLPLDGPIALRAVAEGPVTQPLVVARITSPVLHYNAMAVNGADITVAYASNELDVASARAQVQGATLNAAGRIALVKRPDAIELLARARAATQHLPQAAALLPGMTLDATLLATASDPKLIATQGVIAGSGPAEHLGGSFAVDSRGVGSAQLSLTGARGDLSARAELDRPHNRDIAAIDMRDLKLQSSMLAASVSGSGFATLHGNTPVLDAALVASGTGPRAVPLSAATVLAYGGSRLRVQNAAAELGQAAYLTADGTVNGVAPGSIHPAYDLTIAARDADVGTLAAFVAPQQAGVVEGSVDVTAHVGGAGSLPSLRGALAAAQGSVNGLAFQNLHGAIGGTPARLRVSHGGVTVGSTQLAFSGTASTAKHVDLSVASSRANLADFNDFFPTGDVLGGTGHFDATLAYAPNTIASEGEADFSSTRYERLDLGSTVAGWSTRGNAIAFATIAGGNSGSLHASGLIDRRTFDANAAFTIGNLDLATWLPTLGFSAPVAGKLDADGSLLGRFPAVDASVHANITHGSLGRLPLERATFALHTTGGTGRIDSAVIQTPSLTARASGTFGLRANDPLHLTANATSADIGALLAETTGQQKTMSGALDTTLTLTGTRSAPRIAATAQLTKFQKGRFSLPRIAASAHATTRALVLDRLEADLQRGRLLANATLPIRMTSGRPALANAPLAAALTADDLELSNVASLMPQGTDLSGRVDGTVHASGTLDAPSLNGLLTLAKLSARGPQLTTPITGGAQLAFNGEQIALQHALFDVGGGTVTANGTVAFASLRDPASATANLALTANDIYLDSPAYFKGHVNGTATIARAPSGPATLGGTMTLSSARVPATAFLNASNNKPGGGAALPIAFQNFTVAVGDDVRVQSPNVDVGATGSLTLNGTLADLQPSGSFVSTGGTLSFYRTFTVQNATVAFDPQSGIIPDINARASTFITNPDTYIYLHVTGPVTGMQLALNSDPGYDRTQILGLLVGAQQFGAVEGVASTGTPGSFSAGGEATSLAEGQLNTLFTRNLLEPLSSALASTFGATNVQLTSNIAQGEYGASVVKAFGKSLHAMFSESFGFPERTLVSLVATPNQQSSIRATAYTQPNLTAFPLSRPPAQEPQGAGSAALQQLQPLSGTNGFQLFYERKYW